MLVGGGVKDDLRMKFREQRADALGIVHIGDTKGKFGVLLLPMQFQTKEEQSGFALIQADKPRRTVGEDLSAQLRSDGTGRSGYQNSLAGDVALNGLQINLRSL